MQPPFTAKKENAFKTSLISLITAGFCSGIALLASLWMLSQSTQSSNLLMGVILILVSMTCLLITVRIYAHIALQLAQNDQKHLQNALIQAKDMIDTTKQLREDHILLQSLIQNLPFPVWLKDRFGRYLVYNQAFVQQWCSGANAKGKTDADLLNPMLVDAFTAADQLALSTNVPQKLDLRMDIANQNSQWVRIERYALLGDNDQPVGVLGFSMDISGYKTTKPNHSLMDPLTHFANQMGLNQFIETSTQLNSETWCLHLDIDHFKILNDSLGHEYGETLISLAAERIKTLCQEDDFCSRPSADEFVLFWFGDASEIKQQRLADLHAILSQPMTIKDTQYSFTTSIGAARVTQQDDSLKDLRKNASIALFNAKKLGRNQIHWYHTNYENQANRRLIKEQILRQAVQNQSFEIHFQPRINCQSGDIQALECLVRIRLDNGDLFFPNSFIALSEHNGLIRNIDTFVLNTALKQLECWQDEGHPQISLAVNLSTQSISDDLVEQLTSWAQLHPELPNSLELELTEHRLPDNDARFIGYLDEIRALNIHLALDDFGTGYANLSRIPNWPFQILKLDRSFIADLPNSTKQQTVVKSVIELCKTLDIQIVAEGVETQEELTLINELGCHSIQGYFYSKPKPLSEITHWLKTKKLMDQ